jgi:DNA (cytosine-5)-methyltransferase 1
MIIRDMDIKQSFNDGLRELALFAGVGGGILGGSLLGWCTVCAVEVDEYAACVLAQRQNDGILSPFPIWDDICTFDGRPWRGLVDVVSGGFPCQDISAAGRGAGIEGERSSLWKEMARVIEEVSPIYCIIENSPQLRTKGLNVVVEDLTKIGYDCEWGIYSAEETGAFHERQRMWIVATKRVVHDDDFDENGQCCVCGCSEYDCECPSAQDVLANTPSERQQRSWEPDVTCNSTQGAGWEADHVEYEPVWEKWPDEPRVGRVADGVAYRMDRLKAIGNGQVPRVVYSAFRKMTEF